MTDLQDLLARTRVLMQELEAAIAKKQSSIPVAKDGFSETATELGGWSHSLLDAAIAELKAGDDYEQEVGQQTPKFIVFDPRIKERVPADADAANLARLAFRRQAAMQWLLNREPFVLDYAVRKPQNLVDDDRNDYYDHKDSHGVILLPAGMDPETGIRKYVESLHKKADWARRDEESGRDEVSDYLK